MNDNFSRYGEIFKSKIYGNATYVVNSPEYCEHILRRNWLNYPRKGLVVQRIALALGNNLITTNGNSWARHRRLMQPAFTKSAIERLCPMIASVNAELLARWMEASERGQEVNVTRDLSRMVLKITLASIFGDDYDTASAEFQFFAEEGSRDLEFAQRLVALRRLILKIVAERRRRSRSLTPADTLGIMMQARDRDRVPIADERLASEIVNLVVAGHETTASVLNWLWHLLAAHPEAQQLLALELKGAPWGGAPALETLPKYPYTRRVIDEALRLYPPLWLMSRKALADDRLGEYFVPAGTHILISPFLIQRSPQLWEEPDRFDPDRMAPDQLEDRHELAFCPFGAGPRKCIGDALARVEIQMHLMMFAGELRLLMRKTRSLGLSTGINLISKTDFYAVPEALAQDGLRQRILG